MDAVRPKPSLTVSQLNEFLRSLPSLGDDAEGFERDIRDLRAELPPHHPREGWEAAFREMAERGDDELIDGDRLPASKFDNDEWNWQ